MPQRDMVGSSTELASAICEGEARKTQTATAASTGIETAGGARDAALCRRLTKRYAGEARSAPGATGPADEMRPESRLAAATSEWKMWASV